MVKNNSSIRGYTLLELIVVIAGLGILASLAIPNFMKFLEEAKIDQAKSLLNSAASECLQMYRSEGISALSKKPSILERQPLPDGYSYLEGQDKCQAIAIEDSGNAESLLVTLGLTIDDASGAPKVAKWSVYKHPDTKYACEQWGGCGEGANVQAIIEEQKRRAEEQARLAAIEQRYNSWLKGPPPGTGNYTQDGKNIWAFQGRIVGDESQFKKVIEQECGKELLTALDAAISSKHDGPFTYTGTNGGCSINTYLCSGSDVKTKDAYDACKKKEWDDACDAELFRRKTNKIDGLFDKLDDGRGCTAVYLCNGTEYTKSEYDESKCGKKWVCKSVPQPCVNTKQTRKITPACVQKGFVKTCPPSYTETYTVCVAQPNRDVCDWQ